MGTLGGSLLSHGGYREGNMKLLGLAALISLGLCTSTAALPVLGGGGGLRPPSLTENVRIVCEQSGQCYRPQGRRPVARWIYGDGAFYGPYEGSGYYGLPGRRYKWSFFSPWNW
jgi:hypothetical protein